MTERAINDTANRASATTVYQLQALRLPDGVTPGQQEFNRALLFWIQLREGHGGNTQERMLLRRDLEALGLTAQVVQALQQQARSPRSGTVSDLTADQIGQLSSAIIASRSFRTLLAGLPTATAPAPAPSVHGVAEEAGQRQADTRRLEEAVRAETARSEQSLSEVIARMRQSIGSVQIQQNSKVSGNPAITGATKTKITYDTKGLVTAGTDATTADIADSTNRRYVTDAQQTVIAATSGTNTGDETVTTSGALINGATSKATPVDADHVGLMDSAASNVLKKLSWANIKATLKDYFDTLYVATASLAAGVSSFLTTPTSANLAAAMTDETGSGSLVFATAPTLSAAILGGITDVSGGKLKFPGAQSASSDVNTLDDYEEGTFTPALTFGGAATGMTFTTQVGGYTKIGRVVIFRAYLVLSAKGSSTGAALITSLPFSNALANSYSPCSFVVTNPVALSGGMSGYVGQSGANSDKVVLRHSETGVALNDTNFGNTTEIFCAGFYFAAT